MNEWNADFKPRPEGWTRLSAKLAAFEKGEQEEARVWRAAAVLMMIALVGVMTENRPIKLEPPRPPAEQVRLEEGQAAAVPGAAPNVRYFWIFHDSTSR